MNVDVEFFSVEQLDNVISSMYYRFQKVIFIGYEKDMTEYKKKNIDDLLKKFAGVSETEYHIVRKYDFFNAVEVCEEIVKNETGKGNRCYFDLTGGADLIIAASGIVAERYNIPLYRINIRNNSRSTFENDKAKYYVGNLAERELFMDIKGFIELMGAHINETTHKDFKVIDGPKKVAEVKNIWNMCVKFWDEWNYYAALLAARMSDYEYADSTIVINRRFVERFINKNQMMNKTHGIHSFEQVSRFLSTISSAGLIKIVNINSESVSFRFNSHNVKECLCDGGAILELYICAAGYATSSFNDSRTGVIIEWDKRIYAPGRDVNNEIDVMMMRGNIPVFISCKNGQVDKKALYELNAVADKLGGRYAKKILVASKGLNSSDSKRAEEMGFKVIGKELQYNSFEEICNEIVKMTN